MWLGWPGGRNKEAWLLGGIFYVDTWESPKVMAGPVGVRKAESDAKVLTTTFHSTPPPPAIDAFLKYPKFKIKLW